MGTRRENIRTRQTARTDDDAGFTDTGVELRHIYGWTSKKPHAAKRSKPRPKAAAKAASAPKRRAEREARRAEVRENPAGLPMVKSSKRSNPKRYR